MEKSVRDESAGGVTDDLFEEYFEARESDRTPDTGSLLLRAGPLSSVLQRRIRVYEALRALGQTLRRTGAAERAPARPTRGRTARPIRPTHIGRFELIRPLGHGGCTRIYLARDAERGSEIALRVLSPLELGPSHVRGWMLREGRALAALDHEGVVRVHEVGEADDLAFVAMERIHGAPLRAVLSALRGEPVDDRLTMKLARLLQPSGARSLLAARLARALAYCHAHGVLHRDLRPENVMITADQRPVLVDFGLALDGPHAARPGVPRLPLESPAYLAPEQLRRASADTTTRAEVYSFGVVLYELLTGDNPLRRDTDEETLRAVERASLPRPRSVAREIPPDLERIALHCLEARAEDRYGSMLDVAADLEAFLDHRSISLCPSPLAAFRAAVRRRRQEVVAALVLLAVLLVGAAFAWLADHHGARAALLARIEATRNALPELGLPDEFEAAFGETVEASARAAHVDGRGVAPLLFAPVRPRVDATIDALSARLAEVLAEERARARRYGYGLDLAPWRGVLAQERTVCPGCEHNLLDRDGGRVRLVLPADGAVRLAAQRPDTHAMRRFLPVFIEQDVPAAARRGELPMTLATGLYRLELRDPETGGLLREGDVPIDWNESGRELGLHAVAPGVRDGMVEVEWSREEVLGALEWGGESNRASSLSLSELTGNGSFWIDRDPVTWGDLRSFADADPPELQELAPWHRARLCARAALHDAGEPAEVRWVIAQAYARWCGARLPTALELLCALRSTEVALEVDPRRFADGSELTSSPSSLPNTMMSVAYAGARWLSQDPHHTWFYFVDREGVPLGRTFRLALSGRPAD